MANSLIEVRILREIYVSEITETIKRLLLEANIFLNKDIENAFEVGKIKEASSLGREIFCKLAENAELAAKEEIPICQDTGMAIIFLEIGQDVHITGGNLEKAINMGVAAAYGEGYMRKSVVSDPLNRVNTGNNAPAVIHTKIVDGDKIKVSVMPKGFGSENMSAIKMLKPSEGRKGVVDFVVETVKKAGSNPCPPIIVGVGIGGTMEMAALISKRALLRNLQDENKNEFYKELEKELFSKINDTGIGPQGMGGIYTSLGVKIEYYPTHIAGLPVAVNISCHATRHKEAEI